MKQAGFTFIELLISIAILAILASAILISANSGKSQFNLNTSVQELAAQIRDVQNRAISGSAAAGTSANAFGIYINRLAASQTIKLYANKNNNYAYQPASDETVENINLDENITVSELTAGASAVNQLSLAYTPPHADTYINNSQALKKGTIKLCLRTSNGICRTILFNNANLIDVN